MARRVKTILQLDSGLLIPAGAAIGKVLTSDGSGNATWQASAGGSDPLKADLISPALTGTPTVNGEPIAGRSFSMAMC